MNLHWAPQGPGFGGFSDVRAPSVPPPSLEFAPTHLPNPAGDHLAAVEGKEEMP